MNRINKQLLIKYDTIELVTDRLVLKKGTSEDCIKIYEYDMLKFRGVAGEDILEKSKTKIDFIGKDSEKYYEECMQNKTFDWYIYLKDRTPIGNVVADREIEEINSIELSFNMHPDYWRKGYMKEAVTKIMDYLFEIGYENIIIGYDTGNYKSKSFAENLGFINYEIIENAYQKNGININNNLMIMPKDIWKSNSNKQKGRKL